MESIPTAWLIRPHVETDLPLEMMLGEEDFPFFCEIVSSLADRLDILVTVKPC